MRGWKSAIWVVAFMLANQVGLAALSILATSAPVLLLVLRPQPEVMLLLSSRMEVAAVILIAAPVRFLIHLSYYELGLWSGQRFMVRTRVSRWLLAAAERPRPGRLLIVLSLLHPSSPLDLALGARSTSRMRVVIALAIGALTSTTAFAYTGQQLLPLSTRMLSFVEENTVVTTLIASAAAVTACGLSVHRILAASGGSPKRAGEAPARGAEQPPASSPDQPGTRRPGE